MILASPWRPVRPPSSAGAYSTYLYPLAKGGGATCPRVSARSVRAQSRSCAAHAPRLGSNPLAAPVKLYQDGACFCDFSWPTRRPSFAAPSLARCLSPARELYRWRRSCQPSSPPTSASWSPSTALPHRQRSRRRSSCSPCHLVPTPPRARAAAARASSSGTRTLSARRRRSRRCSTKPTPLRRCSKVWLDPSG